MRWASWLLGIVGVAQYALIAYLQPEEYVSVDMAYLVMFLCLIGALILCVMTCWGCGWDDGCDCCGDDCECGDGPCCAPHGHGNGEAHGEHGHQH